jgi:hypothetical protein
MRIKYNILVTIVVLLFINTYNSITNKNLFPKKEIIYTNLQDSSTQQFGALSILSSFYIFRRKLMPKLYRLLVHSTYPKRSVLFAIETLTVFSFWETSSKAFLVNTTKHEDEDLTKWNQNVFPSFLNNYLGL